MIKKLSDKDLVEIYIAALKVDKIAKRFYWTFKKRIN